MHTWIALFRGINVGGRNILPMAELKLDLQALNLQAISTYIQSGNVIFDSEVDAAAKLAEMIAGRIREGHGFSPNIVLLRVEDLQAAIESNPFPLAVAEPKSLHFFFLERPAPTPDLPALDRAKSPTESYAIVDRVFYLHAPDGIGRSKLAANAERHLGVVATARNYRTVAKLAAMVARG